MFKCQLIYYIHKAEKPSVSLDFFMLIAQQFLYQSLKQDLLKMIAVCLRINTSLHKRLFIGTNVQRHRCKLTNKQPLTAINGIAWSVANATDF